ncbi:MAG: hypothetical protein MJ060_02845 [Clostridia bacterium]|nr:hypothetical protein [Clostridia bacterium]
MQKEDLLRRLRLFAIITTTVFVVLVVTLLVQFGFIAHYHTETKRLQERNDALQQEIDGLEKDIEYYQSDEYKHDQALAGN